VSVDARGRFADLDGEAFARLVVRTWREYGRDAVDATTAALPEGTDDLSTAVDEGVVFLDRSAERSVVLTVPGGDPLSATTALRIVSAAESPDELTVVAAAGFEPGALSVADAYGMDPVGPEALARLRDSLTGGGPPTD
jgi:hypothetical protein